MMCGCGRFATPIHRALCAANRRRPAITLPSGGEIRLPSGWLILAFFVAVLGLAAFGPTPHRSAVQTNPGGSRHP